MKLLPPPDQRPLSAWEGLRFLLMFPDDPRLVSLELAEQLMGLRRRPSLNYHISRPAPPTGVELLGFDLEAWWNLVFYLQERPSAQESPIPPTPKPGSDEA